MDEAGALDPEIVPDGLLHLVLHHEVLASKHVRDAEEVVVHRPGELQEGPDVVSRPDARVFTVADAEEDPIPKGGVGVGHVRLQANGGLTFLVLPGKHPIPPLQVFLQAVGAVLT